VVQNDIVSKCNHGHFSAELDSIFLDRERGIKKKECSGKCNVFKPEQVAFLKERTLYWQGRQKTRILVRFHSLIIIRC